VNCESLFAGLSLWTGAGFSAQSALAGASASDSESSSSFAKSQESAFPVRWQRKQGRNSLHFVRELRQARQATEVRVRLAIRRALRTSRLEHGLCSAGAAFGFEGIRLSLYLKLVTLVHGASFFPWLKLSLARNGDGRNNEDWAPFLNPFSSKSNNIMRKSYLLLVGRTRRLILF